MKNDLFAKVKHTLNNFEIEIQWIFSENKMQAWTLKR